MDREERTETVWLQVMRKRVFLGMVADSSHGSRRRQRHGVGGGLKLSRPLAGMASPCSHLSLSGTSLGKANLPVALPSFLVNSGAPEAIGNLGPGAPGFAQDSSSEQTQVLTRSFYTKNAKCSSLLNFNLILSLTSYMTPLYPSE